MGVNSGLPSSATAPTTARPTPKANRGPAAADRRRATHAPTTCARSTHTAHSGCSGSCEASGRPCPGSRRSSRRERWFEPRAPHGRIPPPSACAPPSDEPRLRKGTGLDDEARHLPLRNTSSLERVYGRYREPIGDGLGHVRIATNSLAARSHGQGQAEGRMLPNRILCTRLQGARLSGGGTRLQAATTIALHGNAVDCITSSVTILDVYEFLQHAEGRTGGAIGNRATPIIPSAVVLKPETPIETLGIRLPRQAQYPHQAGAPQAIRASMFSTIRAPMSVRMRSMGVRPLRLFRLL